MCFNSGSLFVRRGHALKLRHLLFLYLDVCTQPWASRWVWPSFSTLVLHFFPPTWTQLLSTPLSLSFFLFCHFDFEAKDSSRLLHGYPAVPLHCFFLSSLLLSSPFSQLHHLQPFKIFLTDWIIFLWQELAECNNLNPCIFFFPVICWKPKFDDTCLG